MNWSALVAAIGFAASLLASWVALSMRASAAELRSELSSFRAKQAEDKTSDLRDRGREFADLRSDINSRLEKMRLETNGSYMRANEVRVWMQGCENEIRAIATRIGLMEHK